MKSILLIEDNIDILENLAEYLEMEGYNVLATNNGDRGIEMALRYLPDLIICDMPRPGIDGYEVLRVLNNTLDTSEIPFIFCSTMCDTINKTDALSSGACDYITKPFELDSILEMVKASIKNESKSQSITT